jgi:hypothetical protein
MTIRSTTRLVLTAVCLASVTFPGSAQEVVRRREAPPEQAGGAFAPPPIDRTLAAKEMASRLDTFFTKLAADGVFSGVALVARAAAIPRRSICSPS